ncbi:MAG: lytR [Bacillales bacterium]|nr:lytR [Bacillales bacterium]
MENRRSTVKNKIKKKKIYRIILIMTVLFCVVLLGYSYYIYKGLDKTYSPLDRKKSDLRQTKVSIKNNDPISILLLGVDERKGDRGRSDTMIVVTLNPIEKTMKMLSIPRDTRTEIVGKNKLDKINHSYAFGGVKMSIETVEKLLDIPIDYYAKVNMEGLSELVDQVGGIEVNSSISFRQDTSVFVQGNNKLNGKDALTYVRMRKEDPKGDFGRQERQRQVIEAILTKSMNITTVNKISGIVNAIGDNIETNIKTTSALDLRKGYLPATKTSETLALKGKGSKINGVYYYIVDETTKQDISNRLRQHLELN